MKTNHPIKLLACVLTLAGAMTACTNQGTASNKRNYPVATNGTTALPTRDDRNSVEVPGRVVGGGDGPEYRVRTGSQLPDTYNRRGYTTDSRDPSFVYDQNDQRLQSTNSVGDSLRSVPGVTVSGMR